MALTARALLGLAHAAGIAGTTVDAFTADELERLGLYWADHADAAAAAKKLEAFDKADSKATKEQIIAEAEKVEAVTEVIK